MKVVRASVVERVSEEWRGCCHQPLVVEERSPKRPLIKAVGNHVVGGAAAVKIDIDRQLLRVVVTHRQAGCITAGHVSVLLAAIDLILLAIETMHDILRAAAREASALGESIGSERTDRFRTGGVRRGYEIVDVEGLVLERA